MSWTLFERVVLALPLPEVVSDAIERAFGALFMRLGWQWLARVHDAFVDRWFAPAYDWRRALVGHAACPCHAVTDHCDCGMCEACPAL